MNKTSRDGIQERKSKDGKVRYCFQIRRNGFEVFQSHRRRTDAVKERNRILVEIENGRFQGTIEAKKHTLKELIERYEKSHGEKIASAKQRAEIRWWKEKLGERRLFDLTPILIAEYRDKLQQEISVRNRTRSNGSVRRHLAVLSHIFSIAVREYGWVQENPVAKVSKPKEAQGRVRFLSPEERQQLLIACKESSNSFLYPVVVVALSTGMRLGEIMNLRWSHVDLVRGRITLSQTKNGTRRGVPLAGLALDLLVALKKSKQIDTDFLFPSPENPSAPIDLRFPWERALKKAGIENFRFHDLRHSAASEFAMNGASLAEIAEILGHKTLSMVKRYAHLSETHTSSVVSNMNKKIFGS